MKAHVNVFHSVSVPRLHVFSCSNRLIRNNHLLTHAGFMLCVLVEFGSPDEALGDCQAQPSKCINKKKCFHSRGDKTRVAVLSLYFSLG